MKKAKISSIITVILVVLIGAGSAWSDVTDGLIAHWKFDEGTGDIAHDSANGCDGNISGASWISGILGSALSFDGEEDYINLGLTAGLSNLPLSNFTVCTWIYDRQTLGTTWGTVIGCYSSGSGWCLRTFSEPTGERSLYLEAPHSGGDANDWATFQSAPGTIQPNSWYHVAAVWDAGTKTAKLYINSTEPSYALTRPGVGPYNSDTSRNKEIGRIPHVGGIQYFNGIIDDVRIYDRALSAKEVEELYLIGMELTCLEIVGPNEVAEESQAQYQAVAVYDNNSTRDVTNSAVWGVEPNVFAQITGDGLLETSMLSMPTEQVTVYAEYTEGNDVFSAEKDVEIYAVCPEGSALEYDGENDIVKIGPGVVPVGPKSIFAWVRIPPVGQSSGTVHDFFIWEGRQVNDEHVIFYFNNGTELKFWNQSAGGVEIEYEYELDDDLWHFVGITHESNFWSLYLDGQVVTTEPGADHSEIITGESIGGDSDQFRRAWLGVIDEVSIFDRALDKAQIETLMLFGIRGDDPNLVAYWSFDEGRGQVAHDGGGNGHHGYLGTDPCEVDDADPAWVDSDVPYRCTLEGFVERNLDQSLQLKHDALEMLAEAIEKEWIAKNALETYFDNRNFGSSSKRDIVKAKQQIHQAIQHEEQAEDSIDKSVEDLEDSLDSLGL